MSIVTSARQWRLTKSSKNWEKLDYHVLSTLNLVKLSFPQPVIIRLKTGISFTCYASGKFELVSGVPSKNTNRIDWKTSKYFEVASFLRFVLIEYLLEKHFFSDISQTSDYRRSATKISHFLCAKFAFSLDFLFHIGLHV